MAELVYVVPSRGRPASARRLIDAFAALSTADTDLRIVLQEDDPQIDEYPAPGWDRAAYLRAPARYGGTGFVAPTNWAAVPIANALHAPFAIGFMGDDHLPRTEGWDARYLETLRELRTGYVYGDDLFQGPHIPTQVAVTSDIVREFGYLANPVCAHLYADTMWGEVGAAAGCLRYLPGVVIEHLHYGLGKSPQDATYAIGNSPQRWEQDAAAYRRWQHTQRVADVDRIRNLHA